MNRFLISIFCPDRSGLIASITGALFEMGANLNDTSFSILGSGAKFSAVCTIPDDMDEDTLAESLYALEQLDASAEISVTPFRLSPTQAENAQITHQITLLGQDHPGLVARLTEVFGEFDANIVQLNAETIPHPEGDQYRIRIAAWLPAERADACLATIGNTASTMQMSCHWNKLQS